MKGLFTHIYIVALWTVLIFLASNALTAYACPQVSSDDCPAVGNYIDFNCDGKLRITLTGDSIAYGRGDDRNGNQGGYVVRANNLVPEANFINLGVPGITSGLLLRSFKQNLRKASNGTTKRKTRNLDMLVIDVGRNDWWHDVSPALVARNVKRLINFLRDELSDRGATPLVVGALLIPNNRGGNHAGYSQSRYVEAVNQELRRLNQTKYPIKVRFDKLPAHLLQTGPRPDAGLHPTSRGYRRMSRILTNFVKKKAQTLMHDKRLDEDCDGIFDICEAEYGTDPSNPDTDGDGHIDGEEVFVLGTDPNDEGDPAPTPDI